MKNDVHSPCVMVIDNTYHMWYSGHRGIIFLLMFKSATLLQRMVSPGLKIQIIPFCQGIKGSLDVSWINAGSVLYDGTEYISGIQAVIL